ncbi:Paf1 complex component [Savitreella phatthalungensis]
MSDLADDLFGGDASVANSTTDAARSSESAVPQDVPVSQGSAGSEAEDAGDVPGGELNPENSTASKIDQEEDKQLDGEDADDDLFGDEDDDGGFVVKDEDADADKDAFGDDINEESSQQQQLQVHEVEVPNYGYLKSVDDDSLYLAKLPNALSISSDAYEPAVLLREIHDDRDEAESAVERSRRKTDRVENTIRWRWEGTGDERKRVSNARFVKWSDGSMSLQIGAEFFDVPVQTLGKEHNYLTLMQSEQQVLRSVKRFTHGLNFLPYSLNSKVHRDIKSDIARRTQQEKQRTVKEIATLEDPEERQKRAAKAEADRIKSRRRLEMQRARAMGISSGTSDGRRSRLTAAALDDNSDDELGAGTRGGAAGRSRYYDEDDDMADFISDDEADEQEEAGASRLQGIKESSAASYADRKRKATQYSDDEDDEVDDEDEEEEAKMTGDEDDEPKSTDTASRKKLKRRIADSDDEDDE